MSKIATARIPASTTNLGPGFDVLGLALQLYSTVKLETIENGTEIVIRGVDADKIPNGADNIAFQAANLVFKRSGHQPKGIKLVLTNGIPAIRGLGGSGTAILGGFSDRTDSSQADPEKRLIIRGTVLMGGVDIKN